MDSNPLEKTIEQKVCDYAKKHGALCYKFTSMGKRSVPDRLVILPGGLVFFIEFKMAGKQPTPSQRVEITRLQQQGVSVYVIDSIEAGKRAVDAEILKSY